MWLKIRQVLFVWLCLTPLYSIAQSNDSIAEVLVSNQIEYDAESGALQLNEMDYPFFDVDASRLYYYFELSSIPQNERAFLFLEIKKRSNFQFKLKPEYTQKIKLSALLQGRMLDSIDLDKAALNSGNYDLIVTLLSDSSRILHQKKAGFQLLRKSQVAPKQVEETELPAIGSGIVHFEKTFAGNYNLETLKKNISALGPIAEGSEIKVIKEIVRNDSIAFLRQFFYNFWYNRNPSNPESEWKLYAEKLNYVGKKYGSGSVPGYESDRGKIYLMFGEPDVLERVINEKGARPYEVWFYYNTAGRANVKLLFCQTTMLSSQMLLLHSTEQDIVFNQNWKQVLLEDPNNQDTKLMHRVFEYFK